jgi:outer membrane receptor for ferrienterochelin and colicins
VPHAPRWAIFAIALSFRLPLAAADDAETDAQALAGLTLDQLMQMRIDTVYGASKYEQKVTQAPASVTILTAEDFKRFGYRTLADALKSIRGLYVSNDRNYSYLGTRGFLRPGDYNSRILLLIDGHRLNDSVYDAAYFGREALVSVDMIDRVEFVRGPSSSIYGSSAFFGIVNVVLKRAADLDGTTLAAAGGDLGTREGTLTFGDVASNGLETTLNAAYFESRGYRALYFPEFDPARSEDPLAADDGMARDRDAENAYSLYGRVAKGSWALAGSFLRRTKDVPTATFATAFNREEETVDDHGYVDGTYARALTDSLQLHGRLAYDRYAYEGDYPFDDANTGDPKNLIVNKDASLATTLSTEWQLTRQLAGGSTVLGGFEYRDNLKQRQLNYDDVEPRVYAVDDNRQTSNAGVYVQGEFKLAPPLLLNAGLRYDYYFEGFGGTLNPRVGAILSPTARTTFKLLYGEAFRAPNAYERFYYAANATGQSLKPETIRTYEGVLEQYLGERDRLSVSVYRYAVSDLISEVADSQGELFFENVARVSAHGAEIELERKYDNGALIRGSYAWQETTNADTNQTLSASPNQVVKLNLSAPLRSWASLGAELQFQSRMRNLDGSFDRAFTIANISFQSSTLPAGLQLEAGVYNLFDARYAYPGAEENTQPSIVQDGRTFRVKVTRRF